MTKLQVWMTDPHCATPKYLNKMAQFVASYHPCEWSTSILDHCHLMEIGTETEQRAIVWFAPVTDNIIEAHACAAPQWQGRWITRNVLDLLQTAIGETEADYMIAQVTSPLVERIWRRLGLEIYDTIAVLHPKE